MIMREPEFDLSRLWQLIARNIRWIMLLTLLGGVLAFLVSSAGTKVYQSSARLLASITGLSSATVVQGSVPVSPLLSGAAYKEAALSNTVVGATLEALGAPATPKRIEEFKTTLKIRTLEDRESKVLILSVQDDNPVLSTKKANAWAKAVLQWDDARVRGSFREYRASLQAQLEAISKQIRGLPPTQDQRSTLTALQALRGELLRDIDLVRALERSASGQLSLLDSALVPSKPVAPKPLRNAAIGAALALMLSLALVLLREALERSVRSSEEAHHITQLPVLGEFPKLREDQELPRESASYLLANINQTIRNDHPKIVAVVSPAHNEGRSSVALSLAKAYARAGKQTLLIDLDIRQPSLHTKFKPTGGNDIIRALSDVPMIQPPAMVGPNLYLLPCLQKPEDPIGLISESFQSLTKFLSNSTNLDVVIIDTAPVLVEPVTLLIVSQVSGVILTVSEGSTLRNHLRSTLEILKRVKAQNLGLAVTNVRFGETFTLAVPAEAKPADPPKERQTEPGLKQVLGRISKEFKL